VSGSVSFDRAAAYDRTQTLSEEATAAQPRVAGFHFASRSTLARLMSRR